MRLIFAGGGGASDSAPLDELFARWVDPGTVLYWPFASDSPPEDSLQWFTSIYGPLGIRDIEMWRSLDEMAGVALGSYPGVYIGGGNTFSLLASVRRAGAGVALMDFVRDGGVIYGGSAGAILLGRDIGTADHADPNDVGLRDTTGLDMARGHAIWCHYQPAELPLIRAWSRATHHPVLAMSERTGIAREADDLRVVGSDPVFRVDGDESEEFQVGELVPQTHPSVEA